MPLITLTCDRSFFPPDAELDAAARLMLPAPQDLTLEFAQALPRLIVDNTGRLSLDPETTDLEGVQVNLAKFHTMAVNTPSIWIHVWFAEPYPLVIKDDTKDEYDPSAKANAIVDALLEILTDWFKDRPIDLSFALDVFWGPGHGAIVKHREVIELRW